MRDGTTYAGDMPWPVRGVVANDDYTLTVTFASGETKLFDFTPYLRMPFYSRPRNKGYFRRARAERGTVVWDDEVDFPETLYGRSVPV